MNFLEKAIKIKCCDRTYSTQDPDTYLCFSIYKNNPTKSYLSGEKVFREYTVFLFCPKCNHTKALIYRYDTNFHLMQRLEISGKNLKEHHIRTEKSKQEIYLKSPDLREELVLNYIPLKYFENNFKKGEATERYLESENRKTGRVVKLSQ